MNALTTTETAAEPSSEPAWPSSDSSVAPVPLQNDHSDGIEGGHAGKATVRIISMSWNRFPCSCGGTQAGGERSPDYGKPILTIAEAARMLDVSKKRMEDIIFEEKTKLGRLPDFVCNAGGKIQRRIIRDEFLAWVKLGQAKRGRPVKQLR